MKSSRKFIQRFCRCYLRTMDAARAAEEVGISPEQALELLMEDETAQELEACRQALARQFSPEDALRRLAELAFGRANDCVRLVMEENTPIDDLDLSLLAELKRGSNGVVEVRLIDRVKVLDRLLELLAAGEDGAQSFLEALSQAGDEL